MHFNVLFFIVIAILICPLQCYHHERGKISKITTESAKRLVKAKTSEFHTRKRKSFKNKVFEKEKRLFELTTVNGFSIDNELTTIDKSAETDTIGYITTLLPLPKGIQLKAVTKYHDSIIHAAINISSSTQKIITFDNQTETENFVKMEMEKKIDDVKGANEGYENVRIVERKRIKPLVISKIHRRNRGNHKNRYLAHHRSKRSRIFSDEVPKSKFIPNKMDHRLISAIKRKKKVVGPNRITNQHIISDFQEINPKATKENAKGTTDSPTFAFMKFFLYEMQKFRKSLENKKNISAPPRRTCKECTGFKLLPHETKKQKKTSPYSEHLNVIMSLNMTWDSKMKDRVAKSIKVLKGYDTVKFENTSSTESNSEFNSKTPTYGNEIQSTRFLTGILSFSVMILFLVVLAFVLPKLYKWIKLNHIKSSMRNFSLYADYPKKETKEIERKKLLPENYQELEWQSENGDWLSEKESEIK